MDSNHGNVVTLAARVPETLRQEFEQLARDHERSTSAELRVAVRRHLDREQPAQTRPRERLPAS
jgi:predicted transcriptional regulator